MNGTERINIDVFKTVTRAIAESNNLGLMANHLTQLLVGALDLKGCTVFALNPDSRELEILASFGLSLAYLNKGPIYLDESLERLGEGKPVLPGDLADGEALQYPEQAAAEGIRTMITVPVNFCGEFIGALRLYHQEPWEISDADLDSLLLLAETIGLALTYTRLLNVVQGVREALDELPAGI
jgi:GAF domain-containing protein